MHIKTSQNVVTFIKQSPLFKGQCRIGGVMVSNKNKEHIEKILHQIYLP
jgi:hypothetical protein